MSKELLIITKDGFGKRIELDSEEEVIFTGVFEENEIPEIEFNILFNNGKFKVVEVPYKAISKIGSLDSKGVRIIKKEEEDVIDSITIPYKE